MSASRSAALVVVAMQLLACPRRGEVPRYEPDPTSPASTRVADERAIEGAMAGYLDALAARDPAAASSWVASSTFALYEQLRVLARTGTREQLEQQGVMEIWMVLELRNRYDAAELDALDARTLFETAIREGMSAEPITPDEIRFAADGEHAEVHVQGAPVLWFVREQGRWCIDLSATITGLGPLLEVDLADAIADAGKLRVVFGLLESQSVEGLDLAILDGPRTR
jgi:hypothetical protein